MEVEELTTWKRRFSRGRSTLIKLTHLADPCRHGPISEVASLIKTLQAFQWTRGAARRSLLTIMLDPIADLFSPIFQPCFLPSGADRSPSEGLIDFAAR
jgi:hypothetical protein